jgi:hypothetical protein
VDFFWLKSLTFPNGSIMNIFYISLIFIGEYIASIYYGFALLLNCDFGGPDIPMNDKNSIINDCPCLQE